ncbi:MAG: hypothetical protein JWL69_1285 [Phycisphaerales bacterium]|nr:hypothetical protein [Phycisphaerales bacterium]
MIRIHSKRPRDSISKTKRPEYKLKKPSPIRSPSLDSAELPVTFFSDVRSESNRWLWRGRIPRGALTLLTGDPDKGKSLLTVDWAARVSTGAPWPDGRKNCIGTTVFLCPEDERGRTIIPRFIAAGGNRDRACFLHENESTGQSDEGASPVPLKAAVARLERVLRLRPDVRLIVFDPLNDYLAGLNTSRDGEVRAAIGPLIALARRYGFAVVGLLHLNKSSGGRAMYRSLGSIGLQGLARASWLVAPDPRGGKYARVMVPVKFNLGRQPWGIAFSLVSHKKRSSLPVIRYDAFDVDLTADDALAPSSGKRQPAGERAEWFLRSLFAGRAKIASSELFVLAEAAGVSKRTIARAIGHCGIETFKDGRKWAYRPAGVGHDANSGKNGRTRTTGGGK